MALLDELVGAIPPERKLTLNAGGRRWAIVLAGGEGARLSAFTAQQYGVQRPKQYCTFWGGQTMLQWTLDRIGALVKQDHTKIIIGNGHERMFAESVADPTAAEVIVQPTNNGTLPGILLPLSHILAEDPEATVLLAPSDHFILPAHNFVERSRRAIELAERYPDKLVLLGAVPDSPVPDYGWVQPGDAVRSPGDWSAQPVSAFIEKPGQAVADTLYRRGWLWNTMIVAGKAKLMWNAAFECAEDVLHRFNSYRQTIASVRNGHAPDEHARLALQHLYSDLGTADFSRDLLQRVPERCAVLPLSDVYWCDCGHPERLAKILEEFGEPADARDHEAALRATFEDSRTPAMTST